MLQEPTECSGFTAGLDTPYNLLIVDPPRQSRLFVTGAFIGPSEVALGTALLHASLPPSGGTCLYSSPLRLRAFGQVPFGFVDHFATPLSFISRSRVPSGMGEGGITNTLEDVVLQL